MHFEGIRQEPRASLLEIDGARVIVQQLANDSIGAALEPGGLGEIAASGVNSVMRRVRRSWLPVPARLEDRSLGSPAAASV
jgi:hypothetical protein